jgi:Tfp pilus assembly protein PilF
MSDWLDAEHHAERAFDLFERGRWAEAESELRRALELNPEQAEWHFNLGLTLEASGRDVEALTSYERAAELLPDQPDPMVAAGTVANRVGQFDKAQTLLTDALAIDSQNDLIYANLMESHFRLGNHEEAETTFYLAQQALDEPSAQCHAVMAESLLGREDFDRAEWCLREALRLDPAFPRLRARLAVVLQATGKPQRALQMYLRDLRDNPGSIETLLDYGDLLIEMGRVSEAAEKFRRVLELQPANEEAHFRLGELALAAGRFEQAHLELELVHKLDPGHPRVRIVLAEALFGCGQPDEARTFLNEALEQFRSHEGEMCAAADCEKLAELLIRADLPQAAVKVSEWVMASDGETPDRLRQLALARFSAGDRAGGIAASRRILRIDSACVASMHNLALAALEEGRLRAAAGWISAGLRIDRRDDGLRRLRTRLVLAWIGHAIRSCFKWR